MSLTDHTTEAGWICGGIQCCMTDLIGEDNVDDDGDEDNDDGIGDNDGVIAMTLSDG